MTEHAVACGRACHAEALAKAGRLRILNGVDGISDIEGKATGVGTSERG